MNDTQKNTDLSINVIHPNTGDAGEQPPGRATVRGGRRAAAGGAGGPPPDPAQATGAKMAAPKKSPDFKFNFEKHTRLALMLRYVQCKKETDELGSDNIRLGAVSIDGAGNVVKLNPITISNDFDEGEYVDYSDTKPLLVFNLNDKAQWPKTCQATIMLAEIDSGA
jgi:hypothetical protein